MLEKDIEFDEDEGFSQKSIDDLPKGVKKYDDDDENADDTVVTQSNDNLEGIEDDEIIPSDYEDDDMDYEDDDIAEEPSEDSSEESSEESSEQGNTEESSEEETAEDTPSEDDDDTKDSVDAEDEKEGENEGEEPKNELIEFFSGSSEESISEENIVLKFKYEIDNMADLIIKFQDKSKDDRPIEDSIGEGIKEFVEDIYKQTFDVLVSDIKSSASTTVEDFNNALNKTEVFIGNSINDYDNFGELIKSHKSVVDDIKKWMLGSITNESKESYTWGDVKGLNAFSMVVGKLLYDKDTKLNGLKKRVFEKIDVKFANLFINIE